MKLCSNFFCFALQIREKHLLDKAYVEYPDFPLVVTGHSLGAGTAVILSFMLRLKYNSVKCFAFGPPGGLLNSQAYAISTTFVTSVVVGDDIICRYVHEAFLAISWRLCHVMLCRVVSCRGVFRTFELRVLTVIDCPKIAGAKGLTVIDFPCTRAKYATAIIYRND